MKKAAFLISIIVVSVMFGAIFQNCAPKQVDQAKTFLPAGTSEEKI